MTDKILPDFGKECWMEYNARAAYNRKLNEFRAAALESIYNAIKRGLAGMPDVERAEIWDEFCRRAKATAEERRKAEGDGVRLQ